MKLGLGAVTLLGTLALSAWPKLARAEVTLAKLPDDWELYATGRMGAFAAVIEGYGVPQPRDPNHALAQEGIPFDADSSDGTSNKSGHGLSTECAAASCPTSSRWASDVNSRRPRW